MQMGERQPKTEYKNVVNSYRDYFYGDEVLETRIGMICAAHRVLEYYDGYRTTRNTYVTSEMLLSRQMFFPLDGFWTEDEGKSSVFWKFEKLENSYHLYRYQVDDATWQRILLTAEAKGIKPHAGCLKKYAAHIRNRYKALMAMALYDDNAYYRVSLLYDHELQKAVKENKSAL